MPQLYSVPWNLKCAWCPWFIEVNARGMRGEDPGSGVEAARWMEEHVIARHGKTWQAYLAATC